MASGEPHTDIEPGAQAVLSTATIANQACRTDRGTVAQPSLTGCAPVPSTVAALYVERNGCYWDLPNVDAWDEARDARLYAGPHPVVSHTPCQRWGKMWFGQPLTVKRTGVRKVKGDDGGCFAHSIETAREFGGVIEHPWGSHAWAAFGLNIPPREGGWVSSGLFDGGWTCCVEQGRYGHYARKPTMLVVYGVAFEDLPELDWGIGEPRLDPAVIERMGLKRAKRLGEVGARGGGTDSSPRIGTPEPFRDLLLSLARSSTSFASEGHSHADERVDITRHSSGIDAHSLHDVCGQDAERDRAAASVSFLSHDTEVTDA